MNSSFSDFIRNATPEEKERVYMEVIEKACERQIEQLRNGHFSSVTSQDRARQKGLWHA